MSRSSDVEVLELAVRPSDAARLTGMALAETAATFGLLADPSRLRLLAALLDAEASVGGLAASAGMSESGASHALRLLRAHRIVQARRDGRMVYYRLADDHVRQLLTIALDHAEHGS